MLASGLSLPLPDLVSAPVLNSPYRRSKIPHLNRIWVTKSVAWRRWLDCCKMGTWTRFVRCTGKAFRSRTLQASPALTARQSANGVSSRARPAMGRRGRPGPASSTPKPYIDQRLSAGLWNATVLLRELREQGCPGGYPILKDYLHLKHESAGGGGTTLRDSTGPARPGRLGYLGTLDADGQRLSIWSFVLTLGHSRAMYAGVATDQKT